MEFMQMILGIVFLFVYLIGIGLGIAQYIVQSFALYRLGKNCGMKHAWVAWIPVGSTWAIGCVTDRIDAERGFNRKWRSILLVLTVIMFAVMFLFYVVLLFFCFASLMELYISEESMLGFVLILYLFLFLMILPSVLLNALMNVCIYKIFEFYVPDKAIKYFVLSFLVPLALPICLLKCSRICREKPSDES